MKTSAFLSWLIKQMYQKKYVDVAIVIANEGAKMQTDWESPLFWSRLINKYPKR